MRYVELMRTHVDLFATAVQNETDELVQLRAPPVMYDDEEYDIVFKLMKENDAVDAAESCLTYQETVYGLGVRVTVLTVDAITQDILKAKVSDENGARVCIGAALRVNGLRGVEPFSLPMATRRRRNRKGKKNRTAEQNVSQKVANIVRARQGAGYDHVVGEGSTNVNEKMVDGERMYWNEMGVFAIIEVRVKVLQACGVCFADCEKKKGWMCAKDHLVCNTCFDNMVQHGRGVNENTNIVDEEGWVVCPTDGCEERFEEMDFAKQKTEVTKEEKVRVAASLRDLRMKQYAKKETQLALDDQRKAMEAEFERIQKIADVTEQRAEMLRMEVINNVLTLRCPNPGCKKAFYDFDGCFSVTCSHCRGCFCAWCVGNFNPNGDVHVHAGRCVESEGVGLFASQAHFQMHQAKRRKRLVIERLKATEDQEVRAKALSLLKNEMRDLGISIQTAEVQ